MSEKKFELPPLPWKRGRGLAIGTASERRAGKPRTEAERATRHPKMFPSLPELPFTKSGNPGLNIEDFLPAPPPDLPLPRFLVKQMKKK